MGTTFQPGDVDKKDPDATDFYYMDWSGKLADGETISTSTWTVQEGLTATSITTVLAGSYKTRVTLAGGQDGADYACTNRIVTTDGRTLELTGIVRVREL